MAKNGAPRMAIAACYGGPLLSIFSSEIPKMFHFKMSVAFKLDEIVAHVVYVSICWEICKKKIYI